MALNRRKHNEITLLNKSSEVLEKLISSHSSRCVEDSSAFLRNQLQFWIHYKYFISYFTCHSPIQTFITFMYGIEWKFYNKKWKFQMQSIVQKLNESFSIYYCQIARSATAWFTIYTNLICHPFMSPSQNVHSGLFGKVSIYPWTFWQPILLLFAVSSTIHIYFSRLRMMLIS